MVWRIMAIVLIYLGVSTGWFLLAQNMDRRSTEFDARLEPAVGHLWGVPQAQQAPEIHWGRATARLVPQRVGDLIVGEPMRGSEQVRLPLSASDLDVHLSLTHRRKGLLWFPTYRVRFRGAYRIQNPADEETVVTFVFPLPATDAVYDDFLVLDGERVLGELPMEDGRLTLRTTLAAGEDRVLTVAYQSQGMSLWTYRFGQAVSQIRNFKLRLATDFSDIDFPVGSLAPSHKERTDAGWALDWRYSSLLSGVELGMIMPEKLNPGPWVSRVTQFAPVSLGFFFFLLFIICILKRIDLHPMNYFFLAAAFFAFHLLLAYLVDHIDIHLSFWIAAAVSLLLVTSYMRLVVGVRFALVEVGLSQLVYLVGFAYSFFFEGATGLAVAVLSVIVLFVVMQVTGRLDWGGVFADQGRLIDGRHLSGGR